MTGPRPSPQPATRTTLAGLVALVGLAALASCAAEVREPDLAGLRLARDADGVPLAVEVTGLSAPSLAELAELPDHRWPAVFDLRTAAAADDPDAPGMLGNYVVDAEGVRFEPRFPFVPGIEYRATFTPRYGAEVELRFSTPDPAATGETLVAEVFPSAPVWPMNQLKMYVHFSASMRRGDAFDHIRLINETRGEPVEQPFVTVQEELWDRESQVLTILFDPARIKRGLVPNQQAGLPLQAGDRYRLEIDGGMLDAEAIPLMRAAEHRFTVGPIDRVSPHPSRWRLSPPAAGSRAALVLELDEPLDHGLLHTLLAVRRTGPSAAGEPAGGWRTTAAADTGDPVAGSIETDLGEAAWRFRPRDPWAAGHYELVVPTLLEDLAGNTLRSLFDVDLADEPGELADVATVYLPFRIVDR